MNWLPWRRSRRIEEKLTALLAGQHETHRLLKEIVMLNKDALDLLAQIDTATTGIGAEVTQLISELPTTTDPALIARLQAIVTNLNGIAKDPSNPVPAPVSPAP